MKKLTKLTAKVLLEQENRFVFCCFLLLALSSTIKAQNSILASCKTAHVTFYAKNIDDAGLFFMVEDSQKGKTDTLLISSGPYVQNCFCNDTLASFYVNYLPNPEIELFKLKGNKWTYVGTVILPQTTSLTGVLLDGEKYEFYDHLMVSTNKVVSTLTVYLAKDRKLNPIEKYSIEYKISPDQKMEMVKKELLAKG